MSSPRKLVLGTRGSALALWQARHVAGLLSAIDPDLAIEERIIQTEGDLSTEPTFGNDDRGVFVRRIEQALVGGEIDLAVHSMKDLPTTQPPGLVVAAVPEREDPRDALVSVEGWTIEDCPDGATVGTGSPRRRSQLLHRRPGLLTAPVRGNVDTRVRKLREGQFAAVVLAMAGLRRLEIGGVEIRPLDPTVCLPAVGQGALAIETRETDAATRAVIEAVAHAPTACAVEAERACLRRLGGGCLAPAGAHATTDGSGIVLQAVVGDADGKTLMREQDSGPIDRATALGEELATRLLAAGAGELLASARE